VQRQSVTKSGLLGEQVHSLFPVLYVKAAHDALGERNKDNGLRSQQGAIDELQRCVGNEKDAAARALSELSNLLNNLQMASPGNGDGSAWRARTGLPRGGPSAIITDRALLRFDRENGEAYLASVHPGSTRDEVVAQTGWALRISPQCGETQMPTPEELRTVRECDPEGFWTGRSASR